MIRNLVGALVYVGAGKQPPAWIARAARRARPHARRRRRSRPTASTSPAPTTTRRFGAAADAPRRRARRLRHEPDARQDLRHHARRGRARGRARRRRRDRPRLLAGDAAPRRRSTRARAIAAALPPFVSIVGLFVDPTPERRARGARRGAARRAAVPRARDAGVLPRVRPALPQGDRRWRARGRFARIRGRRTATPRAVLFDAPPLGRLARRHGPDVRLDARAGEAAACRWCCPAGSTPGTSARRSGACGRGPSTCRAASRRSAPTASRSKGIKDPARIAAFVEEVRNADD